MPSFSTLWLLNAAAELDAAPVVDERRRAPHDVPRALAAPGPRRGSPARRTRRGTASRPAPASCPLRSQMRRCDSAADRRSPGMQPTRIGTDVQSVALMVVGHRGSVHERARSVGGLAQLRQHRVGAERPLGQDAAVLRERVGDGVAVSSRVSSAPGCGRRTLTSRSGRLDRGRRARTRRMEAGWSGSRSPVGRPSTPAAGSARGVLPRAWPARTTASSGSTASSRGRPTSS